MCFLFPPNPHMIWRPSQVNRLFPRPPPGNSPCPWHLPCGSSSAHPHRHTAPPGDPASPVRLRNCFLYFAPFVMNYPFTISMISSKNLNKKPNCTPISKKSDTKLSHKRQPDVGFNIVVFTALCRLHRRRSSFRHFRQVGSGSHPDHCGSPQSFQEYPSQRIGRFSLTNMHFPGMTAMVADHLRV